MTDNEQCQAPKPISSDLTLSLSRLILKLVKEGTVSKHSIAANLSHAADKDF
jgi:hypothetical protein